MKRYALILTLVLALAAGFGCSKKTATADPNADQGVDPALQAAVQQITDGRVLFAFDKFDIQPEYKEVLLKTKLARDNESEEMIDIIINSISFDFGINAWQNEVGVPVVQRIYVKNDPNVASTLAKMQKSVDAQIKKLVEKLGK